MMGQNLSSLDGSRNFGRRKSIRSSLRSPFTRRSHTHQGNLSAAFNFIDSDLKIDQLNINSASEEELMTLPGITRNIAQNIVEYRRAIGGFKKVEDLALVTGIGAEKLDYIRPEICINKRKNVSCSSSCAQSCDSLPSFDQSYCIHNGSRLSPYGPNSLVDVNSASVFDLMTVPGLNQELAANILHYIERRGQIHNIDELSKVKGMSQWKLGTIRPYLVVRDEKSHEQALGVNTIPNGSISEKLNHIKLLSNPSKYKHSANGFIHATDVYELLSKYSPRPVINEDFNYVHNGKSALRVASWNLHELTLEKVENYGVKEVICLTILENRFSFIAVQEVSALSLKKICEELNQPSLQRVASSRRMEDVWKYAVIESENNNRLQLGFLYNSSCDVELCDFKHLEFLDTDLHLFEGVLASVMFKHLNISVMNVYFRSSDKKYIDFVEKTVSEDVKPTDMLMILGDFSGLNYKKEDQDLRQLKYHGVVSVATCTNSCNTQCSLHYSDNIFLNKELQQLFTGSAGVIRQGLTHLAIPHGWSWGGAVSEHCPVWCEIYTLPVSSDKVLQNGSPLQNNLVKKDK